MCVGGGVCICVCVCVGGGGAWVYLCVYADRREEGADGVGGGYALTPKSILTPPAR